MKDQEMSERIYTRRPAFDDLHSCIICTEELISHDRPPDLVCPATHARNTCDPAGREFPLGERNPLPRDDWIGSCTWDSLTERLHDLVWRDQAMSSREGDDPNASVRRVDVRLPCGHVVHAECLLSYMQTSHRNLCPLRCGKIVKCGMGAEPPAVQQAQADIDADQALAQQLQAQGQGQEGVPDPVGVDLANQMNDPNLNYDTMTARQIAETLEPMDRVRFEEVRDDVLRAVERTAPDMNAQELSEVMWQLGRIEVRGLDGEVLTRLLAAVVRTGPELNSLELHRLMYGLRASNIRIAGEARSHLESAVVRTIAHSRPTTVTMMLNYIMDLELRVDEEMRAALQAAIVRSASDLDVFFLDYTLMTLRDLFEHYTNFRLSIQALERLRVVVDRVANPSQRTRMSGFLDRMSTRANAAAGGGGSSSGGGGGGGVRVAGTTPAFATLGIATVCSVVSAIALSFDSR